MISGNDIRLFAPITISPNATLNVPGKLAFGSGLTLSAASSGTMVLSNPSNNMYGLTATVNGGTLQISNGVTNGSTNCAIVNNSVLAFAPAGGFTFGQNISGSGTVAVNGPGTLTLSNPITGSNSVVVNSGGNLSLTSGASNYTGPTNVLSGGTLVLTSALPATTAVTINSGAVGMANGTGGGWQISPAPVTVLPGGLLTTPSGVSQDGLSSLTLAGGTLAANAGVGNPSWILNTVNITAPSTISAANLQFAAGNSITISSGITVNPTGYISGGQGFTLSAANSGTLLINRMENTGSTNTVNAGTLQLGDGVSSGDPNNSIVNNSVLVFNPGTGGQTFPRNLSGSGAVVVNGPNALTISSPVTGGLSLTVNSGAYLSLTNGGNAYSGPTNVASGGSLTINGNLPASTTVTINSGAVGIGTSPGYQNTAAPVVVNAGGLLTGASGGLTWEILSNLTLAGGTLAAGPNAGGNSWGLSSLNVTANSVITGNNIYFTTTGAPITISPNVVLNAVSAYFVGSNEFALSGSGTMIVGNNNLYNQTVSSTVSGGTLQLGDGVSTNGSLNAGIVNNSVLVFAPGGGAGSLCKHKRHRRRGRERTQHGEPPQPSHRQPKRDRQRRRLLDAQRRRRQHLQRPHERPERRTLAINNSLPASTTVTINSGAIGLAGAGGGYQTTAANVVINAGGLVTASQGITDEVLSNLTMAGGTLSTNANAGSAPNWELGTINVTANSLINAANIQFTTGSPVVIASGVTLTVPSKCAGNSNLTLSAANSGTMVLSNSTNNMYGSTTTVNGGTLQLGNGVSGYGSTNANITDNACVVFAPAAAQNFGQNITGNGSVVVNGPSSVLFNGTGNNYTGGTFVNGGTLAFQVSGIPAVPGLSPSCTLTINNGGTAIFNNDAGASGLMPAVVINAGGRLTGATDQQLSLYNSVTLNGGTLSCPTSTYSYYNLYGPIHAASGTSTIDAPAMALYPAPPSPSIPGPRSM